MYAVLLLVRKLQHFKYIQNITNSLIYRQEQQCQINLNKV
uniref:Uncharacterized protein n=1 Tax=Rhizophora mucronata TaxID=61149 RepID=A0A2P2MYH4_RHIMU